MELSIKKDKRLISQTKLIAIIIQALFLKFQRNSTNSTIEFSIVQNVIISYHISGSNFCVYAPDSKGLLIMCMDIVVTQSVYIQKTHWLEMKFKMFLNVNNKEEATKRIMEAETSQYQIMWEMLK